MCAGGSSRRLGLLDSYFPPELRQAAAFSALNGENESATFTAKRFAERDPDEAELASAMLRNLPILHGLYFDVLHRPAPPGRQAQAAKAGKGGSTSWTLVKLLPIFLLALIRAFSCNDRDVVVHPATQPPGGAQTMTPAEVISLSGNTWGVLARPCKRTPPELPRAACDAAVRAVQTVQAGDCVGTQDALDEMKSALQGLKEPSPPPVAFFQHKMQSILAAGCTPKPPVVPPR